MDKPQFESLVQLKIRDIVSLIMTRNALDFEEALHYLYTSQLYSMLIDEDTKLWHLSNPKLFDMLINEKKYNRLDLPDYV